MTVACLGGPHDAIKQRGDARHGRTGFLLHILRQGFAGSLGELDLDFRLVRQVIHAGRSTLERPMRSSRRENIHHGDTEVTEEILRAFARDLPLSVFSVSLW
jgi:hypothetical protein